MTIEQTLNENQIQLKHHQEGNQKVKCPSCQPPHNPRDNPLSVTINDDGVVWNCHHCNFKGGKKTGSIFRPYTKPVYTEPVRLEPKQESFMVKFFKERGISESTINDFKI